MRLGLAAIVKNEAPYLVEWVAFHQVIGFDEFLIAENESDDGTAALVRRLEAAGIVQWLLFPTTAAAPQMPAYRLLLERFGVCCDWLAFIDADEFIIPTGTAALGQHIGEIAGDDVGTIALNWAVYGSSGLTENDGRPVVERFTWRAGRKQRISRTYKSIVRPSVVVDFLNPHEIRLADGFRTVMADGRPLEAWKRPGHSARVVWEPFRVNHYVVKSYAEWLQKRERGRAGILGAKRPRSFFEEKDYSDVEEPFDVSLAQATKRRIREIEALIDPESDSSSLVRSAARAAR